MNSINREQPEQNHADLNGQQAIDKIRELVGKAQTCFFCTTAANESSHGARPMNVRQVDDQGNLWFLMANDSHAAQEVSTDPKVKLFFQGSAHSEFMQLNGRAAIVASRSKLPELWEPVLKTWFTEGQDDPRITIVCVTPADGYYWDNKHGNFVAGMKMLVGAAIGKTLDDSIEGKLKV
jgi:general stress protein 26